ncbi:MAG TPA: hypothetical protein VFB39_09175 [Solirubrobacteraceae bacterium]|nr:hypothetical protein [Solirubrobacteraceae bacterium]
MTATQTMVGTGETGLERARTVEPEGGLGRSLLSTVFFVGRQLAGSLAIIVAVWLVVMLFKHVQVLAIILAAAVVALGGGTLIVRNRSLRAD